MGSEMCIRDRGIEPPIPPYKRSLMTALAGDRTADTSGQVINLNTNTAYPRISAIFADSSKTLCQCTLLFCSLSQFPLGKQSFQYVSSTTRTYTLSHQGRTRILTYATNFSENLECQENVASRTTSSTTTTLTIP